DIVGKVLWEQNTSFVLVAIPMFIFMGELLFQSGIMSTVYLRAATVVSGIPGGLLQANIAACTIFAACSGSSVASAATIGSVGYPRARGRPDRATARRAGTVADGASHRRGAGRDLRRHRQPHRGRRSGRRPCDPDRARLGEVQLCRLVAGRARNRAADEHDPV